MFRFAPGLLLCAIVAAAATLLGDQQAEWLGRVWLEPLVLAILLGATLGSTLPAENAFTPGVRFAARTLLEVAIVLLGAGLSLQSVVAIGPRLLVAILGIVALALALGTAIGRALGLPPRLALLVACGNAICGNSAIAAVAPVIGAGGEEVAASIGFTAVIGIAVVLALPFAAHALLLAPRQAGMLGGLTVYAVPQVLAATAPLGTAALHIGTLVKLVRVLALGPVVLVLGATHHSGRRPRLHQLVPWFILGFLAMAACRSANVIPATWLGPIATAAGLLTVLAMAGLGLTTDLRHVASAGPRAAAAATLSLLALAGVSLTAIVFMGLK